MEDGDSAERKDSTDTPPAAAGASRQRTVRVTVSILQGLASAAAIVNSAIDIVGKLT
ncbi:MULTISPECIES: hypothetical protein [unclassified Micromonospora]|uniref:hypothetical protein n=1 Tax=unclassified Micromonospora TaxID=2617518 RepID=UPI000A8F2450|nr:MULTISPECIES: hypothetical protein [unclassified Micromonospora]MCK1805345.1 hypothetical protein [Micromonospora sp. R42106]MCK1830795.1 hypothetical protein [Micromonospora sp. R42003]MCK1842461.1 hypothetical protein [Micromonospora sp. R42004]MCM1015846.1 hypothetical protein [Micromonospora sp. XM-20-01]NHO83321.1 hypothetical protein [Micromonospora sp. CMU55-4]